MKNKLSSRHHCYPTFLPSDVILLGQVCQAVSMVENKDDQQQKHHESAADCAGIVHVRIEPKAKILVTSCPPSRETEKVI